MKRIFSILLLIAALIPLSAYAQTIQMERQGFSFDFPNSWLVISPQLARVYTPLLEEQGFDAQLLAEDMARENVLARAYSEDYSQTLSVIAAEDDLSAEIFSIANVTDAQRKTLRSMAENGRFFETTGLRVQDVEWQKENGAYWLYIHYTKTHADEVVGRGLRYVSIQNGMYVMLDWQKTEGRFSNRDLATFRSRIADFSVTRTLEAAVRTVLLTAQIPGETNTADIEITGETTPNATLWAEAPDSAGQTQTLSVGQAGSSGRFSLLVQLPKEGIYALTLTASMDGMQSASVSGSVAYSAKALPVSLTGAVEGETTIVTKDTTVISGKTLAGVQIQLVTPFGLSKKRAGNDGSFSFELSTQDEGEYDYTLICDKSGFDQRRIRFTLAREMTDEQERARMKESAEKISYKNLQKNSSENLGKLLVIYGPVIDVSSGSGKCYVRMYYNKDSGGSWYNPVVIVSSQDMGVKEGDMLTVAATVSGVYEEQDASGNDVMIPKLDLVFVDRIE